MKVERHQRDQHKLTIGILSDSHARTATSIVELMRGCDLVLHAGDVMDTKVLHELSSHVEVYAVEGNNDRQGVRMAAGEPLAVEARVMLPEVVYLDLPSGQIAMEHGHRHGAHQPDHDKLRAAHPDARMIVYGHTHVQLVEDQQTPWIVNPGASGLVRNHGGPSALLLLIDGTDWQLRRHRFPA